MTSVDECFWWVFLTSVSYECFWYVYLKSVSDKYFWQVFLASVTCKCLLLKRTAPQSQLLYHEMSVTNQVLKILKIVGKNNNNAFG